MCNYYFLNNKAICDVCNDIIQLETYSNHENYIVRVGKLGFYEIKDNNKFIIKIQIPTTMNKRNIVTVIYYNKHKTKKKRYNVYSHTEAGLYRRPETIHEGIETIYYSCKEELEEILNKKKAMWRSYEEISDFY